jgi:hypothetical protein
MQVPLVMVLPKNCCSTSLFTTGYKRLAEGECKAFYDGRILNEEGAFG